MWQYVTRLHQIRQKLRVVAPDRIIKDDFFAWTMLKFARLSDEERRRVLTATRRSWKITKVQNALVKLFPERQRFTRDDDDDGPTRGASRREPLRDDGPERPDQGRRKRHGNAAHLTSIEEEYEIGRVQDCELGADAQSRGYDRLAAFETAENKTRGTGNRHQECSEANDHPASADKRRECVEVYIAFPAETP